jgi:RNA polymerase sigma-70 factor (ECF subfamily)
MREDRLVSVTDPFAAERDRLWGIAYRMLGSRHDADDIVQEAWIRWSRADLSAIERPAAWLTTVTSRLAIDRLRSRKSERATYVGPWLPEPVEIAPDPAELAESVTIGFLTLLERLQPVERIVLLLADVFDEPFDDIATIVGKSPAACRQIAVRARQRVHDERRQRTPHSTPQNPPGHDLLAQFGMACASGDIPTLIRLLGDGVVLVSDGGPQRHAARRPVIGPERVARFCVNISKRIPAHATLRPATINAQSGLVVEVNGRPEFAMVLDLHADGIGGIYVIVNPDKLHGLGVTHRYPSQP